VYGLAGNSGDVNENQTRQIWGQRNVMCSETDNRSSCAMLLNNKDLRDMHSLPNIARITA